MMTPAGGNIFETVTISWDGQDYAVPPEKGMRLAYTVEMALRQDSGLSVFELLENPPLTALAYAYGAALRFAGAVVTDEQVMEVLTRSVMGSTEDALVIRGLIDMVFSMLMPPAALRGGEVSETEKKISAG